MLFHIKYYNFYNIYLFLTLHIKFDQNSRLSIQNFNLCKKLFRY